MSSLLTLLRTALVLAPAWLAVTTSDARPQDSATEAAKAASFGAELSDDWFVSDRFEVRAGLEERLVVQSVCELDGERALTELAMTATTEEAFLFVPSECLWIEIGQGETPHSVSTDLNEIRHLAHLFGKTVIYHIHPGRPALAREYFPAYGDLLNALILSPGIGHGEETEIRHRAVTALGVIDYGFSRTDAIEALLATMHDTGLSAFVPENMLLLYATGPRAAQYYDAVVACNTGISSAPDRLRECFPMGVGEFRLEFREHADLAR